MSWVKALVLGVVQGLTEFVPVSSSAHLVLLARAWRWRRDSLDLEVALHVGCLVALLAYFGREWAWILGSGVPLSGPTDPAARTLLAGIVLACIPAAAAGAVIERRARGPFRRLEQVAALTAVMGALLIAADHAPNAARTLSLLTWRDAAIIGVAQAFALLPGVSRSGVTLMAAVLLGFSLHAALVFSFLVATPILAGAGLWGLRHVPRRGVAPEERLPLLVGLSAAAAVGYVSIAFMLQTISALHLTPFGAYRILFALVAWRLAARLGTPAPSGGST